MTITKQFLQNIVAEARPIIERQMADAKLIAGFRTVVASNGGDWGALKALIKAHVEDENDEAGDGKRVQKILDKADSSTAYADMLGIINMNEKNFSADEPVERRTRAKQRTSEAMDDNKAMSAELLSAGLISPEAHAENVAISDGIAVKFGAGVINPDDLEIPAFLRRSDGYARRDA